jgi:glycosyltransferase involved in cell wall biosynthesis
MIIYDTAYPYMECLDFVYFGKVWSADVPVITTSVGGNEEVVKNGMNGYILRYSGHATLSTILSL